MKKHQAFLAALAAAKQAREALTVSNSALNISIIPTEQGISITTTGGGTISLTLAQAQFVADYLTDLL